MNCVPKSLLAWSVAVCCLGFSARLLADDDESLESLRAAKLKAAQEWWDVLMIKVRVATADPAGADAFHAAKALRDAQIDVAMTKQERVKALEAYRSHMHDMYEIIETRIKSTQAGPDDLAQAKIHLLEAKIALKQEATKP